MSLPLPNQISLYQTLLYQPPFYLRSGHVQTVLSSRALSLGLKTQANPLQNAATQTLTSRDDVQLQATVHRPHVHAQQVILIHGWLGQASSPYIHRMTATLVDAGYNVACLHLRDHGDTEHLNPEMFHSARLDEVVDACNQLAQSNSQTTYIAGFSLGGNFALRLAAREDLTEQIDLCVGICPAIDPAATAAQIDGGWFVYRYYFVRRWITMLREKAAAHPQLYDFRGIEKLNTVAALTEYFVNRHTPYANPDAYYDAYAITAEMLDRTPRRKVIVAAGDDPVIPIEHMRHAAQATTTQLVASPYGGHCAFLRDFRGASVLGPWLIDTLRQA